MKTFLLTLITITLVLTEINGQWDIVNEGHKTYPRDLVNKDSVWIRTENINTAPAWVIPTPHDPDFKRRSKGESLKSFYKSKDNWQEIIDTTWGPGQPLNEKLEIFNAYTKALSEKFDGFNSLGINNTEWDSIKNAYLTRINDSTSRGAFAALMGRIAYELHDLHTYAWDTVVIKSPLNPGTPVLVIAPFTVEHFGAVLTPLPDSSLVVLSTLGNHPLDLQPGDIVLGYEGVQWKDLVDELLEAGIPVLGRGRGSKNALRHMELLSAGCNWHLFDSIDVVKYSSGDTVHLSVDPLLDLPVSTGDLLKGGKNFLLNCEQLPVPGVPFPEADQFSERALSYGIIEGTNIGYIYLYIEAFTPWTPYNVDPQFYEAVLSLLETAGLILDIRINHGGWATFKEAEALLYNQQLYNLEDGYRCNTSDYNLCLSKDSSLFEISGNPHSIYDRPIAVLTGPNCFSMGDIVAYQFSFHPMVRFFGKSTGSSLGDNERIKSFPGWELRFSKSDLYMNNPGIYLNRREFHVDVPVWFSNADEAASGTDPVVQKALEWIDNLAYAHDVSVQSAYVPVGETAQIIAEVENPENHFISVRGKIKVLGGDSIGTVDFYNDGNHSDGEAGDGIWGAQWLVPAGENYYTFDVTTDDPEAGSSRTLPQIRQFTSAGPVKVDGITIRSSDTIFHPGFHNVVDLFISNRGSETTVTSITASVESLSQWAEISVPMLSYGNIQPGAQGKRNFSLSISEDCPSDTMLYFPVAISSNDFFCWADSFSILVQEKPSGMNYIQKPVLRIYPNPTYDFVNLYFEKPIRGELEIHHLNGQLLFSREMEGNTHQLDLSSFQSGVYFITIRSKDFVTTRKIIKL